MTDIDRGAYAPQHDGPSMSFDPRRSRARQPAPFTLIFSGVVLAALIVAVFMFYRGGVREAGAAPATVGAPVVAMKGPATVDTAPATTEESLDVYVGDEVATAETVPAAPAFAAPPEQPQPRPAPRPVPVPAPAPAAVAAAAPPVKTVPAAAKPAPKPVQVAAATPAPAPKPTQTAAAAPAKTTVTETTVVSKPVQTAAATPAPAKPATTTTTTASATTPAPWGALPPARANGPATTTTAATSAPAPAPTQLATVTKPAVAAPVATPKPAATTTSSGGGRYGVQIGAFSSASIADAEYAKVSGVVGGRGKVVTPVKKDGSTFYRTVVMGFGSKAEADATCAKLKAAGKACFVKGV